MSEKKKSDKDKMWERLKYVKPTPEFDMEKVAQHIRQASRAYGKTNLAMQLLGRALRNETKDTR